MTFRHALIGFAALSVTAACGKEAASASSKPADPGVAHPAAASNGNVDLGSTPYRGGAVTGAGAVSGRVTLDSAAAPDSAIQTAQGACAKAVKSLAEVERGAVVWIADPKAGKAPPIERRFELASEDCVLDPQVQGAVTGSTFNVLNADRELHRLVFVRLGTNDTLTRMPFYDDGEVVASERLAKNSGVVTVQCTRHPWMRAYIAVFEHPYFAVTESNGRFRIDSLPPGKYKLMVWRPGLSKPISQEVQVSAGGESKIEISAR